MIRDYRTPNTGALYTFSGWPPGHSPVECWDAGDWLGCLHGCMLCLYVLGDALATQTAVADDGLLHELVHLAEDGEICTHHTEGDLRTAVQALQGRFDEQWGQP